MKARPAGRLVPAILLAAALAVPAAARATMFCDDRVEVTAVVTVRRVAERVVEYWARLRNTTPAPLRLRFSLGSEMAGMALQSAGLSLQPGASLAPNGSGQAHVASYPLVRGYMPTAEVIGNLLQVSCDGPG